MQQHLDSSLKMRHVYRPDICIFVLMMGSSQFVYAGLADLPPPATSLSEIKNNQTLYLDYMINGSSTHKFYATLLNNGHYYALKKDLVSLGVNLAKLDPLSLKDGVVGLESNNKLVYDNPQDWVNLSTIKELNLDYLPAQQRLVINLPPNWLAEQSLGRSISYERQKSVTDFGAMLNFDLYSYDAALGGRSTSLWNELRLFGEFGSLSSTGVWSKMDATSNAVNNPSTGSKFMRYDTAWQYDDEDLVRSYAIGDINSGSKLGWGSSIRLGGLMVERNNSIRPDIITYPLPQFKGESALPSTVDLFINGTKAATNDVQSGPFVLNSMPYINGRGEAVIVTRDVTGRSVTTTLPFYVASDLLKQGLSDYSVQIGALRKNYGIKNFDYGTSAGLSSIRYGVTDNWTAEGRIEGSQDVQVVGVGTVNQLGLFGVVNFSVSQSHNNLEQFISPRSGQQITAGYRFNMNKFGFNINHTYRGDGYSDLSRLESSHLLSPNTKYNTLISSNYNDQQLGSFGVGYFDLRNNTSKNRILNASWAPILPEFFRQSILTLSGNHDIENNMWGVMVQFSMPLDKPRNASINTGYEFNRKGGNTGYANFTKVAPTDGGIGYSLTQKMGASDKQLSEARVNYNNPYLNADAGISGKDDYNKWFGVSSSLIFMDNSFFMSRRIYNSFALVTTQKVKDIPVRYENTLMGKTNDSGHLFIPNVSSYYGNRYSIDPLDLPAYFMVKDTEKRVTMKRNSGAIIKFAVEKVRSANVHLKTTQGAPIPAGSIVSIQDQEPMYVGWDGILFLERLQEHNLLNIETPDGDQCQAKFVADVNIDDIQTINAQCVPSDKAVKND